MAREHRTPLRRVSHGSLSALARSTGTDNGPTGLDFLEPAFTEFADEAATMHRNMERMGDLYDTLETFNESFCSFLYALNMNAYTVEWPQAPRPDISFRLAEERAELAAAQAAARRTPAPPSPPPQAPQPDPREPTPTSDTDATRAEAPARPSAQTSASAAKGKPGAKPKMTAKEKKERNVRVNLVDQAAKLDAILQNAVDKIINALPLEYRGSEPRLRENMEAIINKLMDAPKGLRLTECINPPELPQARVNKCLIALVNRKAVKKTSAGGSALYTWVGIA